MVNVTPLQAKVAFITVTAVQAGNFSAKSDLRPEANGVSASGASEMTLEQHPERAAEGSGLVKPIFTWLSSELARQ
jgi:hypothetical protein